MSWINKISPGPIGDMFMKESNKFLPIQKYSQLICAKCAHYHSCDTSCPTSQKTKINLKEL